MTPHSRCSDRGNTKVSVAIPTRNRVRYLMQALDSVLGNGYSDFEIIVSDNASTDGTNQLSLLYQRPEVRWFRQATDLGMVGNWNFCLSKATGGYFLLLSDDDQLMPGSLTALVRAIDRSASDSSVAFSYGSVRVIASDGSPITTSHSAPSLESADAFIEAWLKSTRSIYPCALLTRTQELIAINGYASRYGSFADVGSWAALLQSHSNLNVAFVESLIAEYRIHDSNLSSAPCILDDLECFDRVVADFPTVFAPARQRDVQFMRASVLASKLRLIAKAKSPKRSFWRYLVELCIHSPLVMRRLQLEPYFRNGLILASPQLYELYKHYRIK